MANYNLPMTDLIARLSGTKIASPNRYWVEFSLPQGVTGSEGSINNLSKSGQIASYHNAVNASGDISLRCNTMVFPARSIMTTETRHYGTPFKLPYALAYEPVTFSFTASEDLRERKYFEVWQEAVANISSNTLNFYNEYISNIRMIQLDKKGDISYSVTLYEAFPINISAVDYSAARVNDFQTVSVSMAFRHWMNDAFEQ